MNTARAAQGDKKAKQGKSLVSEKAVEVVKVGRYWPGKAPAFQGDSNEDVAGSSSFEPLPSDRRLQRLAIAPSAVRPTGSAVHTRHGDGDDAKSDDSEDSSDARRRRRRARFSPA